jgi:monoterpene epsilon-lactone hydrolase
MFLGDAGNADDTMANPLYADYAGFQRIYVDASSDVTLLDDSRRLASRARVAGVDVAPSIVDHMQHVFPILEGGPRKPTGNSHASAIGTSRTTNRGTWHNKA